MHLDYYYQPTFEGYQEAKQYIIDSGKEWLIEMEGYAADSHTIINLANELKADQEANS